ncbi:peptidyl-prolyl cis-trans isomerase [Bacillus sp. REN16]|uniref:peptidyl-prolyl cis-trans isomerase n=1 Tax=Bacillus sp. REN16 TaxID=2887296 RepID=UPI001E3BB788|nr:peptidyl-prolyl cis-trans isomerase [Bacillus sp. REN16]MCC3357615.1 peptidyl-prolyl cis-trans isomerase [Bacillus sp. REN16]
MNSIIMIEGKTKYKITLDPSVWIFDDRRVDLLTYFESDQNIKEDLTEYTKSVSKHWDREIREGAVYPPTLKTEKKFLKEQILTGTFGIPFEDFIKNAEPFEDANSLKIVQTDQETTIPLSQAYEAVLGFSIEGKPLREDGPVHVYFGDGSNRDNPIKNVTRFIIE